MVIENKNDMEFKKIRELQESFEKNIRILESHVAESIINKKKIASIKKELKVADEKFIEAQKQLDDLNVDIENIKNK